MSGKETAVALLLAVPLPVLAYAAFWQARNLVREFGFRRGGTAAPQPGELLDKTGKTTAVVSFPAYPQVRFTTAEGREVVAKLRVDEAASVRDGTVQIRYDPADPRRAAVVRPDGTFWHTSVFLTGFNLAAFAVVAAGLLIMIARTLSGG
jgi:hypothetical protein